ncbi:MAG: DEAD/DEAH box helicase [Candidatus Nanoarchaeia archaeon]
MEFKGFKLDDFQKEAITAVENNNSVIVSAPTGSGKTLIADFIIDRELKGESRVIYTAPVKALSNQKFLDFCNNYGEDKIGLITGDIVQNPSAQVLIMTTEVYRNMAIISDPMLDNVSYVIMDEIHYIGDSERGHVWEESIIFSDDNLRFLCLSATIPNADEFAGWLGKIKNHNVEIVQYSKRPVPLEIKFYDADLGICSLNDIKEKKSLDKYPKYEELFKGKRKPKKPKRADYRDLIRELKTDWLPCLYFVFSRLKTQDFAQNLARKQDFLNRKEKQQVAKITSEFFAGVSKEILGLRSTLILKKCLLKGVAFHHAGLVPDAKHIVEKLFARGLVKVLFTTETFALGVNMPAKSVCLDSLRKFTNEGFRFLNSKEFFQITGRAGRRGIDEKGLGIGVVRKGDDLQKIASFTKEDKMPINSQFKLSYNTILNMIEMHTQEEIEKILTLNLYTYQELKGKIDDINMLNNIRARYQKAVSILEKKGYIVNQELTQKGRFAAKIFSNELEISEIFFSELKLSEYRLLLILGALVFEERKMTRFFKRFPDKDVYELKNYLQSSFPKAKWVNNIPKVTAIIKPAMEGQGFLQILKNTNFLEGDLIRIYMQILDRLEQIDRACSQENEIVQNCKDIIKDAMKGISIF